MPRPEEMSTLDRLKRALLAISTALVFLEVSGIEPTGFSFLGLQGEIGRPDALWLMAYAIWVYHLWQYSHLAKRSAGNLRSSLSESIRLKRSEILTPLFLATVSEEERKAAEQEIANRGPLYVEYQKRGLSGVQFSLFRNIQYGRAHLKPPVRASWRTVLTTETSILGPELLRDRYFPEVAFPSLLFIATVFGLLCRRVWPLLEELAHSW